MRTRLRFRPRLVPTLVTLVLLPVLVGLGFWQLDRAEQRRDLVEAYERRDERSPVDLNRDPLPDEGAPPRNASGRGRFDGDHQFLLDNQVYRREAGYHVLTPFRLAGREAAILVDRGWVPAGDRRAELPDVAVAGAGRPVRGHLDQGPATGIRLGGMSDGESGWPLRVQYIDYAALEARLGYPLVPWVLRLDPEAPDGYVREWGPAFREGYGPERNEGYAVQWFALAAALLVIFLSVNTRRVTTDDTHE